MGATADSARRFRVHLLDMGRQKYGDCVLCEIGDKTILIDGGHRRDFWGQSGCRSIPQQLETVLGHGPPFLLSLVVITHFHSDHAGCIPMMVAQDTIRPQWALLADERLGTGRPADDSAAGPLDDAALPPVVRRVAAALREEAHADLDDAELAAFLDSVDALADDYPTMIETLLARGTQVVRYGRNSHAALVGAFADVGMAILGPNPEQLVLCAEEIARLSQDVVADLMSLTTADAALDERALYRLMAQGVASDALDRWGKGAAINAQSIVLAFDYHGSRALLTGDMQLARAEVPGIDSHVAALRAAVAARAPYDVVKMPHHTSYNALDEHVLHDLLGTLCYGHSGGSRDSSHPSRGPLALLEQRQDELLWARTDRNGLVSFDLAPDAVSVTISKGSFNDFTPNAGDVAARRAEAGAITVTRVAPGGPAAGARPGESVEIVARLPHTSTQVTLTIDVAPRAERPPERPTLGPAATTMTVRRPPRPGDEEAEEPEEWPPRLAIADGRPLPHLLFVTRKTALAHNIGHEETAVLLAALRERGCDVLDALPEGLARAAAAVRQRLTGDVQGVVLIGGHDVVPSQRLDVLDPGLRQRIRGRHDDHDDFIVWSDALYGDRDGDGLPELPVSRIPDGRSSDLVFAAIQAPRPAQSHGFGIRNVARPFADPIYASLRVPQGLLVSAPTTPASFRPANVAGGIVYLMLHGAAYDASRFWGEDDDGYLLEAINVASVPKHCPCVVVTGCCWGALTATTIALHALPQRPVASWTAESSMALAFLRSGALAFVGCTGTHYSPVEDPFGYFGGPMHQAFWTRYAAGDAPAKALFEARTQYLGQIPHGRPTAVELAIELKIYHQFCCLGLGW